MKRIDNKLYFSLSELQCVLDILSIFRDSENTLYKRVCNLINYYARRICDSLDTQYSIDLPEVFNHSFNYRVGVDIPFQPEFDFDYVYTS